MKKDLGTIELLENMNKQLAQEPLISGLPWQVKLKNAFDFVKEIFFGVTGVNMWISAFKKIKTKLKEPAYGSITLAIFKSLTALFIPAVFIGLVLSIIHVIIPVMVITSLFATFFSVLSYQHAYEKIYITEGYERSKPIREMQQKQKEIQRRNEVRNKHKDEIAKFRNLCQKYIEEYDPSNFNELNSVDNKQNLDIQTISAENTNKNEDNTINNVNDQSLKKDENQQDNKERPKLASLHDSTIDKKTHASGEKTNEL